MKCIVVNMKLRPPGERENRTDAEIIAMFNNNNLLALEQLYDKYAALMFGAILRITDNIPLAEKILIQSFSTLIINDNFSATNKILWVFLLHHVNVTAATVLGSHIIKIKKVAAHDNNFPVINGLLYQSKSIKESTRLHGVSENELRLKLRSELNEFRNFKFQNKSTLKTIFN